MFHRNYAESPKKVRWKGPDFYRICLSKRTTEEYRMGYNRILDKTAANYLTVGQENFDMRKTEYFDKTVENIMTETQNFARR
jgi:hypothetical protein